MKDFTGLPDVDTLSALFNFMEPHIPYTSASALNIFQQMVLVLVCICQDSSLNDSCLKFNVKKSTATRIFLSVLDILYVRLKPLINLIASALVVFARLLLSIRTFLARYISILCLACYASVFHSKTRQSD